jgi:hypothetical protein
MRRSWLLFRLSTTLLNVSCEDMSRFSGAVPILAHGLYLKCWSSCRESYRSFYCCFSCFRFWGAFSQCHREVHTDSWKLNVKELHGCYHYRILKRSSWFFYCPLFRWCARNNGFIVNHSIVRVPSFEIKDLPSAFVYLWDWRRRVVVIILYPVFCDCLAPFCS